MTLLTILKEIDLELIYAARRRTSIQARQQRFIDRKPLVTIIAKKLTTFAARKRYEPLSS